MEKDQDQTQSDEAKEEMKSRKTWIDYIVPERETLKEEPTTIQVDRESHQEEINTQSPM